MKHATHYKTIYGIDFDFWLPSTEQWFIASEIDQ